MRRSNWGGSLVVRHLQLVHNEWHTRTGSPIAESSHDFGRAEEIDLGAGAARVVISQFLAPERAAGCGASAGDAEITGWWRHVGRSAGRLRID